MLLLLLLLLSKVQCFCYSDEHLWIERYQAVIGAPKAEEEEEEEEEEVSVL